MHETGTQRVAILAGFLLAAMLLATGRVAVARWTPLPVDEPIGRIDPNAAPWWELTALPAIGETTARAIVDYRESAAAAGQPAFTQAADLDRVRGIGPKTIARIAPYLRFDSARPDDRQ